ncbi:hypothetical protein ACIBKY_32895 [Nonomuraea sp. NPDC050394]|uniref:hypothetical protein n=1 Tax=Nonomuraea sp. NPDC050394 TaxID=3364363 RepID=UPI00379CC042
MNLRRVGLALAAAIATSAGGAGVAAAEASADIFECRKTYVCVTDAYGRECRWQGDDLDWSNNCNGFTEIPRNHVFNAGTGSYSHIRFYSRKGGSGSSWCIKPGFVGYVPRTWSSGPDKGKSVEKTITGHLWVNNC